MLVPEYFINFKCKCRDCRNVCCRGWGISLTEAEYYRLLGLSCSKTLRRTLDSAFYIADRPTREAYAFVSPSLDNACRLLNKDGFCELHKQCGETVLPSVCRLYPRSYKSGLQLESSCSASCEATVELLMNQPCPLHFVEIEREFSGALPMPNPGAQANDELRSRCIAAMQNQALSLRERIIQIGHILLGPQPIPFAQHQTPDFLQNAEKLISAFMDISPNIAEYGEKALAAVGLPGSDLQLSAALWRKALRRAYAVLPDCDDYYENLMVNHLFYEQFPDIPACKTPRDAYIAFYAAWTLVRFIGICLGTDKAAFADAVAAAFRYIEHSDFYRNAGLILHDDPCPDGFKPAV
ncbi:MAG TPA: flagellin lysine-N-methylase [Oscillospiraceae bacterium]|nr:flagellin lysine-N-methylase [Oscillospiraceae bacterium]HPK35358.1 flagellin lysine-N-methylase [Oscillospiraceae bacterium]HPR76807.1 flagellin lysine-N-methylase [Oscillospiraceae bacterium]